MTPRHSDAARFDAPFGVTSTSPVAWPHVHLNGRYALRDSDHAIDLDTIIQGLKLE
jgi:hypothetical protein